jgi:hypothetical protein
MRHEMRNFKTGASGWYCDPICCMALVALDDVPGRIQLQSKDGHGAFHRLSHLQDFNGEAFEEQRESAMGFRPRNAHGANAVLGTVHSRNAGSQDVLELAGIQMSTLTLFPMIVTREILLAFRAAESCPPRMINLDSDLLILHVEFDVTDRPWRGHAKNVLVEFFVLHWGAFPPRFYDEPLKSRMGVLTAAPIFHCGAKSEALRRLPVQRRPQLQFRGCQVEPPSPQRPQPHTGPTQLLAVVSLDGSVLLMNWKRLHCLFAKFSDFLGTKQQAAVRF